MNYAFSRKLRLTTDAQFKYVFRKAVKIPTKLCAFFYCHNELTHSRLGVIVPKKNVKKANNRNCFKRMVRESFRLKQHELGKLDIVVLVYKNAESILKKELRQCLENQWNEVILRQKKL